MTRPLFSLSYGAFGGILMVLYSLFLIQLGGLLLAKEKRRKKKTLFWSRWFLFLVTGIVLILLAAFSKQREMRLFSTVEQREREIKISQLPLWSALLGLTLLGTVTVVLIWKTLAYRRTTLNRLAIKESFDNLPTGLCFSRPEGFVLLANRKMEQLCFELTGEDLQDAGHFWEQLTKKTGQIQARAVVYGEQPCFCLENQEIWTFQRDVLNTDRRQLIQLTAVNITELYHLLEQLDQKHLELKRMNGRLRQYSENMESYVRSRELLETKMRIHKEIGQALLASRVYICQKVPELTEQDILKRWESVVLVLKKEAEPEVPENKWLQFVRAAGDAGVQVITSGSIPTDPVRAGISSDGCRGSFDKCRPPRRSGSAEDRAYRRKWVHTGLFFQQREKSHASCPGGRGTWCLAYPSGRSRRQHADPDDSGILSVCFTAEKRGERGMLPIQVLIVEDDPMARTLFEIYLKNSEKYKVAGSVESAAMAELYCLTKQIDLILMDVCTALHASGLDAAEKIKKNHPGIKILIVTSQPECDFIERARRAGVDSFWYKEPSEEKIMSVINRTMEGEQVYPDSPAKQKIGNCFSTEFTKQELSILRELTAGDTDEEIGKNLHLSVWTVRKYIKQMLEKTGFKSRTQLAVVARESGIVIKGY